MSEIIDAYPRIQNQLRVSPHISEKDIKKQYDRREASINRLNELHGKYPISNEDYLYTLVLFVTEPIRWINSWEWRKLDIREVNVKLFKLDFFLKQTNKKKRKKKADFLPCRLFLKYGMKLVLKCISRIFQTRWMNGS